MKRWFNLLMAATVCLGAGTLNAANTTAELVLSTDAAKPGYTILAGVHLKMNPQWHTYWRNGADLGIPTTIAWELPEGITASEIRWPLPIKVTTDDLTAYEYEHEVVLLVSLKIAESVPPGAKSIRAKVEWLECKTDGACVPESGAVETTLTVGDKTGGDAGSLLIEAWQNKLPKDGAKLSAHAIWDGAAVKDSRPLIIEWTPGATVSAPDFFPNESEAFEVGHETKIISSGPEKIRLRKTVKLGKDKKWPREISGVLIQKAGGEAQGFSVTLPVADGGGTSTGATESPAPVGVKKSLWQMLLYAFAGGLILNIMPCVLPVIALKILGFVSQSKSAPGRVRQLGLIYGAGVLASFLILAALVIGVQAAGHKAGWGMQFANPQFIVGLTVLVTLVALNLFGVFEITLSGRVMGAAGDLASQHGASGAFFNGVLATILATPCTAPFLAPALGFAFAQSAGVIVLMFLTVGAGLAVPYVVLSWHPAWLKFLPKPGAWMEKFKIAMGFPMLATAVWLFSLTTTFYGERSWWLGIFLVFTGAAAWMFGAFVQTGAKRRGLAVVIILLLLGVGYAWALDGGLRWRVIETQSSGSGAVQHAPEGYDWQPWSAEAVAKARATGRIVIVDFTAKWCQTCNILVKPALQNPTVLNKLGQLKAVALLADYTRFPPEITDELKRFERAGVPLVLVYPRDATLPAIVLPEPLSPNPAHYSSIILEALEKAAK